MDLIGLMKKAPSHGVRRLTRMAAAARLQLGLWALLAVVLASASPLPAQEGTPQTLPAVPLHVGKANLQAQIAVTEGQRERGLMYYSKLGDNEAMLFVMGNVGPATFWMKNTLIPLSVAFLDKDGVVLEIHDMKPGDPALPDNLLPITRSTSDQVAYALETNVHWFALNGIKPGDKIDPPPATLVKNAKP